jgi:hypothetical protein
MRMKRPGEICAGDRVWCWHPQAWLTVTQVELRAYDTAMLHLSDGRTLEAYANKIVR